MSKALVSDIVEDCVRAGYEDCDDGCCAICFEQQPPVSLPCSCRIHYCAPCWDRALASSVAMRGKAQCPSCRSAFGVDFDPRTGSVVLTSEREGGNGLATNWRLRLYEKARPTQIRLLQRHGAAVEALRGDLAAPAPLCVCGDPLERVDSRSRVMRVIAEVDPSWSVASALDERRIAMLSAGSIITCDLCDENAMRSGACWTCRGGTRTVLHPSAYDVCEPCFARHTGLLDAHHSRRRLRRPADFGASCVSAFCLVLRLGRGYASDGPQTPRPRRGRMI